MLYDRAKKAEKRTSYVCVTFNLILIADLITWKTSADWYVNGIMNCKIIMLG